nr:PREDICTED: T-lymphocyte surface antigen Ly-9 [Anolis carolinensis]|eukprot:XP_008122848.1 PREDICTED: T-lymphocyte surface antigen Ly-9 [Anolis carolinensis]
MKSFGGPITIVLFFLIHTARTTVRTANFSTQVGQSVTLDAEIPKGSAYANIQLRSASLRRALALWIPGKPVTVLSPQFSGRISFEEDGHEFQISHLRLEDGGTFEILMENAEGVTKDLEKYVVFVFNVSVVSASRFDNQSCSMDLLCEAGTGSRAVSYTWTQTSTGSTVSRSPWHHLVMEPKDKGDTYTCSAQSLGTQGTWDIEPYPHCGSASGAQGGFRLGFPPICLLAQALLLTLVARL